MLDDELHQRKDKTLCIMQKTCFYYQLVNVFVELQRMNRQRDASIAEIFHCLDDCATAKSC